MLTERYTAALSYASTQHLGQTRKGSSRPYILHPLQVSAMILECGGTEEEAIAGLLHDVPEHCGGNARLAEIENLFGEEVAAIVRGCCDALPTGKEEKAPWKERKRDHLEHIMNQLSASTLVVLAADKACNIGSIVCDLLAHGEKYWMNFVKEAPTLEEKRKLLLWYYTESCNRIESRWRDHFAETPSTLIGLLDSCRRGLGTLTEL